MRRAARGRTRSAFATAKIDWQSWRTAFRWPGLAGFRPRQLAGGVQGWGRTLAEVRAVPGLVERTRGVFYRRSKPFLHFHEDPSGIHADVRNGDDFERHRAETTAERAALLELIRSVSD